jgi:hypothetical protein
MKLLAVAAMAVGVLVVTVVPSHAVVVNERHHLKAPDGHRARSCSLKIHSVTRDYEPTTRFLTVNGWFRCRGERWTGMHLKFRPHGAGPRHTTTASVRDSDPPVHFHYSVQCNNKSDGATWNHPFQLIDLHSHAYAYDKFSATPYATQVISHLPFRC